MSKVHASLNATRAFVVKNSQRKDAKSQRRKESKNNEKDSLATSLAFV
jgi:hypothetical protein